MCDRIKFTLDPGRATPELIDELYQAWFQLFVNLGGEGMAIKSLGGFEYEAILNGNAESVDEMIRTTNKLIAEAHT